MILSNVYMDKKVMDDYEYFLMKKDYYGLF